MAVYHKLIHGNMLNNYELGDITPEQALEQGYKPLIQAEREENKEYAVSYSEDETAIYEHLIEIEEERITPNDITNENLPPLDSGQ